MAHPDCELFDDDFRLSGQSDGILGSLDLADGERLLLDSQASDGMDLDSWFDTLEVEREEACDVVPGGEDDDEEMEEETRLPSFDCPPAGEGRSPHQGERDRPSSPPPSSRERGQFRIGAVDFDPPAQRPERPPADDAQDAARPRQQQGPPEATNYSRAQRNLVQAMQRSEMTRRHVIAQRDMLPPEQQKMLYLAKERLNGGRTLQQMSQQQQPPLSREQQQQRQRSGMMASFFKNGTLTSGLEQSRRMIGAYMGRVDRGAL